MSSTLRAIAHPTRRGILRSLHGRPLPLDALNGLGVAPPAELTEHLRLLRQAGLVREQRDEAGAACYALAYERLHELAVFLRGMVEEV